MQMKAQRELLDKLLGKDRNLTVCATHKHILLKELTLRFS